MKKDKPPREAKPTRQQTPTCPVRGCGLKMRHYDVTRGRSGKGSWRFAFVCGDSIFTGPVSKPASVSGVFVTGNHDRAEKTARMTKFQIKRNLERWRWFNDRKT